MKPHLITIREKEGQEAFYQQIRNTVAGCQSKWKSLPKEIKEKYIKQAKENMRDLGETRKDPVSKENSKVLIHLNG